MLWREAGLGSPGNSDSTTVFWSLEGSAGHRCLDALTASPCLNHLSCPSAARHANLEHASSAGKARQLIDHQAHLADRQGYRAARRWPCSSVVSENWRPRRPREAEMQQNAR